jgi:hypothetical protein
MSGLRADGNQQASPLRQDAIGRYGTVQSKSVQAATASCLTRPPQVPA